MLRAELLVSKRLAVALDYAQFSLRTGGDDDPYLAVDLLAEAQGGDGIAQRDGLVLVISPHQNNFEMPLLIEVWTTQPNSDLDDWQEAFEVHLDVGPNGLTYESPTVDITPIPVPAGEYHALITGRGFAAQGWPGSTTPGDQWRIRLWPAPGPTTPTRLSAYTPPNPTNSTQVTDGLSGRDRPDPYDEADRERWEYAVAPAEVELYELVRRRETPDQVGALQLRLAIGLPAEEVFDNLQTPYFVLVENSWRPFAPPVGDRYTAAIINDNLTSASLASIFIADQIHRRTRMITMQWNWLVGPVPADERFSWHRVADVPAVLPRNSTVSIQVTPINDWTAELSLHHGDIPSSWARAIEKFWRYRLGGFSKFEPTGT